MSCSDLNLTSVGGRLDPADRDLMSSEVCVQRNYLEYRTEEGKRELESQLRRPLRCVSGILERERERDSV